MTERNMPVTGPHRIYVEAIPAGARLDLESFVRHIVADVIDRVTDANDLFDDLTEVAEQKPQTDGHAPEPLLMERLIERLVSEGTTTLLVYGAQVAPLAESLHQIARPKGLPGQRQAGAA